VQHRPVLPTACFLFLGTWLLLAATSSGHLFVADELCYYHMARSFVDHGGFDVPSPQEDLNIRQAQLGVDGRYYTPFSFGHALYLAPWVWVSQGVQGFLQKPWAPVFTFSFVHAFTTSLTWMLFFVILVDGGVLTRRALLFTLASLFSTLAFPYARSLFSEPALALSLTVAWFCFGRLNSRWFLFALAGGAALAFAVTIRPPAVVLLPGLWLLAWRQAALKAMENVADSGVRRWRTAGRVVVVIAISLVGTALVVFFNYYRFGDISNLGYPPFPSGRAQGFTNPIWNGLAIFLLSPGKAIWLFNPLLILSAIGWRLMWNKERLIAGAIAWVFLANLILHSLWIQPEGGVCWGPRFFVGILPILLLPAGFLWGLGISRRLNVATTALVILGLAVQTMGVVVNYSGLIAYESLVPRWASRAIYYDSPDRYNLLFSPFPAHKEKLREILAAGPILALRPESMREASERSRTHSFPFWCDTLDFWPIHLIKDGYPVLPVLAIETAMVLAGMTLVLLAFRKSVGRPMDS